MGLRKALAYSKKKIRHFTRTSKVKDKAYIKTVPHSKIVKFTGGNQEDFRKGKHNFRVSLIAEEKVQVRDNALESCRMHLVKELDERALGQYYFTVKVHPHNFLRENKTAAAVAGADRISTGMTQSYGTVIGRAAIVSEGQVLFAVTCTNEKIAHVAKDAMTKVKAKVPCRTKVLYEKIGK
jgi:ribosomal protein L10e